MTEAGNTWADFRDAWALGIYQAPILCAVAAGIVLGYLGVFVVLRRSVFVTVTVSQASGLGVVLTFWSSIHLGMSVPPMIGAPLFAGVVLILIQLMRKETDASSESLLGVVFVISSALAVVLGAQIAQESHDIESILFGTAILVDEGDALSVLIVGAVALIAHLLLHRGLVFAAFDREGALVQGVPVRTLNAISWALTAFAIAVTTRALGVLPVFALSVIPAFGALRVAQRMQSVLILSVLVGAFAGGVGFVLAFLLAWPVGPSISVTALMLVSLGLVAHRIRRIQA